MYLTTTSNEITEREIKNAEVARKAGADSIVLLEHDKTLPLKEGALVALYGKGARHTVKGGTGSGDVNSREFVSIEKGLLNGGFTVTTKSYLDEYDKIFDQAVIDYEEFVKNEIGVLSEWTVRAENPFKHPKGPKISSDDVSKDKADVAIYVISRNSGEGADRHADEGDYLLSVDEVEDIETLGKAYGNLVVVLNVGAVVDIRKLRSIEGVGTILLMGQLGSASGDALCDVLSGKVTPSGKLVDTWAVDYYDYPSSAEFSHNNGDIDDEYYTEGIYVGYRYFDSFNIKPMYGFGYGLSYTTFDIKTLSASNDGMVITVKAEVTNTGDFKGKEVVQAYISKPSRMLHQPKRELCCFKKTKELMPGEKTEVELLFNLKDLYSYDDVESACILDKGDYTVFVGNSIETSVPEVKITLDKKVTLTKCKNAFAGVLHHEELEPNSEYKIGETNFSLSVSASDIETKNIVYTENNVFLSTDKDDLVAVKDVISGKATVEDFVSQLTAEEMAELCVGITRVGEDTPLGIFAKLVPGAAGETSSICSESRGLRPIVMADGPAGVRINQSFEHEGKTYYQFCTAIPIGWNLAMTWDTKVLEGLGDVIGQEMEEYRVDTWLAPALNIHRNPLCGRNFEYYSEDPYLSGMMAAAITKGVQAHPGKSVTIKHFAANNLEDNRYFNNSHVSERVLREIYLKGFEICVKTAKPKALMTSYNLINGLHTANHRGLITEVLRDEWEYEGVVMTDWSTTENKPSLTASNIPVYPIASAVGCIYAGNDLIMPGCYENVDDILKAINDNEVVDGFKITMADLQAATLNVVKLIIDSIKAD